jgi:hypothetical protein
VAAQWHHLPALRRGEFLKARDVANALCREGAPFSRRRWIVVPNVSWGWGLEYEADLIAVSATRTCHEIEIKVSRQDLRCDRQKPKHHRMDARIKKFWYAVPSELVALALDPTVVRPEYGVLEVVTGPHPHSLPRARMVRKAQLLKSGQRNVTEPELIKLLHLGVMRYWDLRLTQPAAQ